MLNKILSISLQNRLVVLITALILMVVGVYIAKKMNVDVFPDLTAPTVSILTEAEGLGAEEIEKLITYPIETAMNGATGVRRIRSSSAAGFCIVWVEFDWGTDIYRARQIVSERIPMLSESLPQEASTPVMGPISSIMGEIMLLGITSDSLSPMDLRTITDWQIRPMLKSIPGVANVIAIGGEYKQYQVLVNPEMLKFYDVSITEVFEKVKQTNLNVSGGVLNEFGNQYLIKGSGRINSLEQLEDAVLKKTGSGQSIKIKDVAEIVIGAADKMGDGSVNASPSIVVTISKQPDANTVKLTAEIEKAIEQLKKTLPEGLKIKNNIFKQADFIKASIANLQQTLLEGAFFVVLILIIFLMNWRTTMISLLAIPLSLLTSIIVLDLLGFSINTMSLGGMAIAVGALVDDAIIDVENVFKRLREQVNKPKKEQMPFIELIKEASIEIRSAIIIATLIIIVSFVPLFFLSGMEGRLLKPLGIAFITSVLTSLVVAVTITPVLCSYLLTSEKVLKKQSGGTIVEKYLKNAYAFVLDKTLQRPKLYIALILALFVVSLFVFTKLGRSFLPEFNEGSLVISVVGPPGMSLEESNKVGTLAEKLLLEMPEITTVSRRTGRSEVDEHALGVYTSELDAPFHLNGKEKEVFFQELRTKLSLLSGVNITIGQPIAHRIDHMLSGTRANIAIKIFGDDLARLYHIGREAEMLVKNIEGIADVSLDQQIEVPQIRITPHTKLLAAYGITMAALMEQVAISLEGKKTGEVYEGQRYFDLVVRLQKKDRNSFKNIKNTPIKVENRGQVALKELAKVESKSTPNTIEREHVQRKIVIAANVQNRDLRSAVSAIQKQIEEHISLPTGYRIEYGGQFESETKASKMLMITAIVALVIIFFLLFIEFKNIGLAFIVLINLPLALIGGIFIIFFSSGILNIAVTIGFISLFGIATRNGILLISRYEDLKKEGSKGLKLLKQGALDRLNPILMTAFTTGLALIPLALKGAQAGNEIQSPMAIAILGGLVSATVLNLIIIPAVYAWANKIIR